MGDNNSGLISYLCSFNFDCVFFFDEFEKQFGDKDCSILQFMDGVYTSDFRRVFLLTTNELSVNENLLSRPSRIRYVREFGNLDRKIVEEYLDDNLTDQKNRDELIDYVDTLSISTIDILKSIVEEVNIHGITDFLRMKNSFNVSTAVYNYRVIRGSIHVSKVEKHQYNITKFVEEATRYDTRLQIQEEYNIALAKCSTDSEEEEVRSKFDTLLSYTASMDRLYIDGTDKAWNKLIPQKDDFWGDTVIGVDVDKHVVVTAEKDGDWFNYFLIMNPNERPSLYGKNQGYAFNSYLM
jgi:hypothetical protein